MKRNTRQRKQVGPLRKRVRLSNLFPIVLAPFVVLQGAQHFLLTTTRSGGQEPQHGNSRSLGINYSRYSEGGVNGDNVPLGTPTVAHRINSTLNQSFLERRSQMRHQFDQMQSLLKHRGDSRHKFPTPETLSLPPSNFSEDRIIYFLHIHKSAGSTMCVAARANGLKASGTNCNVQRDQRCCGLNDTLEAQQQYAMRTPYAFVANEQDMYDAMDTDHYRYVVTLRQSRDRYLSHWKHVVRWHYPQFQMPFVEWWKGQPDNWNFRKICGTRCIDVPKYQISRSLWEYTLARLERFDDILLFEQFNSSFARFACSVGWTRMPVSRGSKRVIPYPSSEGKWDPMMSVLDDSLYEVALSRYQNKTYHVFPSETRNALSRYFRSKRGKQCTTPCCSAVCSQY